MLSTTGIATRSYFSKSMATSAMGVSACTDTGSVCMTCFIFETAGCVIIFFSGSTPLSRRSSSTT